MLLLQVEKGKGPTEVASALCRLPESGKKYKELPNTLRKLLGHQLKFNRRGQGACQNVTTFLPKAFEDAVVESIVSRCS